MSTEKTHALVIRQADFSESSRVVTLFSRDFGKISCLAKGAKRLKSAFESSLDILAECSVVFIKKNTATLDLLTEARLVRRFQPNPRSLPHLYAGYYIAELLNTLTETHDAHPELYDAAVTALRDLEDSESIFIPVCRFELSILHEIGQLPDLSICTICHSEANFQDFGRFWVSQSGLICSNCASSEYETTNIQAQSLVFLQQLLEAGEDEALSPPSESQKKEIRRLLTSAVSYVSGKRPNTLRFLKF